jgi:flavocytochrome c
MSKNDKISKFTRRGFLTKGLGAGAAFVAGATLLNGCAEDGEDGKDGGDAESGTAQISWDLSFDVIVVGGGGAALTAAIEAKNAGASVVLLEKHDKLGGATGYSGGVIQASDTSYQDDFGITGDTPQKHYDYWIQAGESSVNEDLVKVLADNSGAAAEWLRSIGTVVEKIYAVDPIPYISQDLMLERLHVVEGWGAGYITVLEAAANKAGVEIHLESPALELYRDAALGVLGLRATVDGKETNVQAKRAVIMACGGFDRNEEMAKAYCPQLYWDLQNGLALAPSANTGDGINMGLKIGADLAGMGSTISYPALRIARAEGGVELPGIWVNKYGQRFVNEATHYGYASRAVFDQEQHIAWALFDQTVADIGGAEIGGWSDDLSEEIAAGTILTAGTIEDLAAAINVHAGQLANTLATWNDDMETSADTLFGRKVGLQALNTGPFYATRVLAYNVGSCGGLRINTEAQVLDTAGSVIPGLYGAGMVTGGFIGPYYPGSGTAIAATAVYGRIAGQKAAAEPEK